MEKARDLSDLDTRFTDAYNNHQRVEVVWKKGYEDFTGYGSRTDGKKDMRTLLVTGVGRMEKRRVFGLEGQRVGSQYT